MQINIESWVNSSKWKRKDWYPRMKLLKRLSLLSNNHLLSHPNNKMISMIVKIGVGYSKVRLKMDMLNIKTSKAFRHKEWPWKVSLSRNLNWSRISIQGLFWRPLQLLLCHLKKSEMNLIDYWGKTSNYVINFRIQSIVSPNGRDIWRMRAS